MARVLYPVLKEATWSHRDLVLHFPLLPRADAPIVCFAEDLPNGYAFLTRADAPGIDPRAVLPQAIRNLQARPTDISVLPSGIAVCGGKDLTAERLLDPNFLAALHQKLGADFFACVPHRVALYAVSRSAPPSELATFIQLVTFEIERGPKDGHAPVSKLAFRVVGSQVIDAMPLDAIRVRPASVPAPPAPAPPAPAPALPANMRHPRDLVLVDATRKAIEASVVLVGSGAKRFARAMLAATGAAMSGPEKPGELEHFTMKLGAIQGWTTHLFVYALDDSFDTMMYSASALVVAANAVILVQSESRPRLEPALFPMSRKAREGGALLAFVGPQTAVDELVRDAAVRPDVVSHDGDRGAIPVLKEITKHILASLRKPR